MSFLLFTQLHCFSFVNFSQPKWPTVSKHYWSNAAITCSSSSSAYFCRLSSFSVPSRSSLNRWASCFAAFISSLSFCSRFTFSTSTVRCSSWAICNLGKPWGKKRSNSSIFCLGSNPSMPKQIKPSWCYCCILCADVSIGLSNPGWNFCYCESPIK